MNTTNLSPFVKKALLWQSIGSVRLIICLFTVGAAVIKLLYNHFLPDLADLDVLRWLIITLGCVFFLATFIPYRRSTLFFIFPLFTYTYLSHCLCRHQPLSSQCGDHSDHGSRSEYYYY